jgi:hypothetical protein
MQRSKPDASGLVRARRGYSLAELLLALTITILVFGAAVPFFSYQMRSLAANLGRTDAQMTGRYAQNTVDRELRNIGIAVAPMQPSLGIPRSQPKIIQADRFAVTFNTDLVTTDTVDIQAVYLDPNVDSLLTVALDVSTPISLPRSGVAYPDYTYRYADGTRGYAETISYWASVDSTASASDEYVLFRRVNNGPVTVVARGIQIPAGQSLFNYTRVDSAARIVSVPIGSLPVYWNQVGSWADSIRTVRLEMNGIFHGYDMRNKSMTLKRRISSQTLMANIGLAQVTACGDIPLNPGTPTVQMIQVGGVNDHVEISWTASNDEASGEKDVERYVIYRRRVGQPFVDPMAVVGKGGANYSFDDFDLQTGLSFEYGVAAQDCSPANSAIRVSGSVLH